MKKTLLLAVALIFMLAIFTGCDNGNVSPSPGGQTPGIKTPAPYTSPSPGASSPGTTAPMTSASPSASPAGTADTDTISGFAEGETVEVSELPEKITTAIENEYPNATIKSITYATYMNKQMYKIILDGAQSGSTTSTTVYSDAAGTLSTSGE